MTCQSKLGRAGDLIGVFGSLERFIIANIAKIYFVIFAFSIIFFTIYVLKVIRKKMTRYFIDKYHTYLQKKNALGMINFGYICGSFVPTIHFHHGAH